MDLLLLRDILGKGFTSGLLYLDGIFECYTLEDQVRPVKIPGETAIPDGRYEVIIDQSFRFKRLMPHILNVPNFEGIRIHAGNTSADTEGCILVGTERREGGKFLYNSRVAFNRLFIKMNDNKNDKCFIEIKSPSGG